MKKYYVTTSIPYVNASPHVGFALELVQADVVARYHRLLGQETRFQTGTDENAFKNVMAAREQGVTTQELVDRNSELFRNLNVALGISADEFLRTTETRHTRAVQVLWGRLSSGDIYRMPYTGLYCTGCEDFLMERDLVDGSCIEHASPPIQVQEENYFFRLSAYQEQIERLIADDRVRVVPEARKNEVLSFIRQGLRDISVSRTQARSGGWGIPVPADPSQVIYVWIDALINYISGLEQTEKIHVIGKNVWKFHAIYWPALLLSAKLPLPDAIVVHGFLTENGRKISKSLGNSIDPFACIEQVGADGVRYYLLRSVSSFTDSDFSSQRLLRAYNTELANDLGNLVSRLTTLCVKAGYGRFDTQYAPQALAGYHEALKSYEFDRALDTIWQIVDEVNRNIQQAEPWKVLKEGRMEETRRQITKWLEELHRIGHWLQPFMPQAAGKILAAVSSAPIVESRPIFPRI
jgi:methionyl-tRNA synthetase